MVQDLTEWLEMMMWAPCRHGMCSAPWAFIRLHPESWTTRWKASLQHRFPGIDAGLLYQAWAAVSEIVPQVKCVTYYPNVAHFSPEGCIAREGFLTVDNFYFSFWPMLGSGILSVEEWGQAIISGKMYFRDRFI